MLKGLKLALIFLISSAVFPQANANTWENCSEIYRFEMPIDKPVLTITDLELLEPTVFRCQLP